MIIIQSVYILVHFGDILYICGVLYIVFLWGGILGDSALSPKPTATLPPTRIYWSFSLSLGGRHPVARNTSEMGISCSLGQQGLHTAPAWDRNSLLWQGGGRGLAGRGMDIVPPGGSEGWVLNDLVISPLSQEPKEVPKCHGHRRHGYPHSLAGCPHTLCKHLPP